MNKVSLTQEAKDALIEALKQKMKEALEKQRKGKFESGINSAISIVESFPVSDGWIPVSERLPEKCGWYLCSLLLEDDTEFISSYWYNEGRFLSAKHDFITHWQSLPNPPTSHK